MSSYHNPPEIARAKRGKYSPCGVNIHPISLFKTCTFLYEKVYFPAILGLIARTFKHMKILFLFPITPPQGGTPSKKPPADAKKYGGNVAL